MRFNNVLPAALAAVAAATVVNGLESRNPSIAHYDNALDIFVRYDDAPGVYVRHPTLDIDDVARVVLKRAALEKRFHHW